MNLTDLEKKYPHGIALLKSLNFYERLIEEIHLLVKYFDDNYFLNLLTQNIFDDMRGVFRTFISHDLKKISEELKSNPQIPLDKFIQQEYDNLSILKSCTTNVKYQVSGLIRLEQTQSLLFKSSFLQFVSRKFDGEIQEVYKELSQNYKKYFRLRFGFSDNQGSHTSLSCIKNLQNQYRDHFIKPIQKFYHLYEALNFTHDLFIQALKQSIQARISSIFLEREDKILQLMVFFIDDLKKNFIRTMDRHLRSGREFDWIQKGFLLFLDSDRFEKLIRKVIYQSLAPSRSHVKNI